MQKKIDFEAINSRLLANAESHLRSWFPKGKKSGKEWVCGDIQGNPGKSFSINLKTGSWADFAGTIRGGDLISLYAEKHNMKMGEAADALAILCGMASAPKSSGEPPAGDDENDKVETIPPSIRCPTLTIPGLKLSKTYEYRNIYGDVIAYVQRYDDGIPGGKKQFRPWRLKAGKLVSGHLPKPRPLWNLNELAKFPEKPVIITEGEKTAEVARSYFGSKYISTTWSAGSSNVKYADWSPLINRQTILIVPDADDVGHKAVMQLCKILMSEYGISEDKIRIVDTTRGFEDGWDIADGADKMGPAALGAMLKSKKITVDAYSLAVTGERLDIPQSHVMSPQQEERSHDPIGPDDELPRTIPHTDEFTSNPYFRVLGIRGDKYYFYKYVTSQIFSFSSRELGEEGCMVGLAPLDYWESITDGKTRWNMIRNYLVASSENYRFDPRDVRKIGMWTDDRNDVVHLGDRLLLKDAIVPISQFKSGHIYEYSEKSVRGSKFQPPASVSDSKKIIEICQGANWSDPIYAKVLAGWMFASMASASLRWRSHIYIIGPAGSGKTWLIDNVVSKFLGDFKYKVVGMSTEASIRQGLANNIIPVIFDEAEAEDINAGIRRKAIFELSRQASAADEDSPISKGSAGGMTKDYYVRSPFLFASINATLEYADETRTSMLTLKPIPKNDNVRVNFRKIDSMCRLTLTEDYCMSMLNRCLVLLRKMQNGFEMFSDALFATVAIDGRHAEQLAFMVNGAWFLENDDLPSPQEAREYVQQFATVAKQRTAISTTEERLMSAFSQSIIMVRIDNQTETKTIGELIAIACALDDDINGNKYLPIEKKPWYVKMTSALHQFGIRVYKSRIYILNDSMEIKKRLKNTPFYSGWDKVLINVVGAESHDNVRYTSGMHGPSISIPIKAMIGEINVEKQKKDVDTPI